MEPYHGLGAGWAVASMKSFGSRSAASLTILQNHLPAPKLWRSWSTVAHEHEGVWLTGQQPDGHQGRRGPGRLGREWLSDPDAAQAPKESGVDLSLKPTSLLHFIRSSHRPGTSRAFTVGTLFPSILPKSFFCDLFLLPYPAYLSYALCIALEILRRQCLLHRTCTHEGIC